MGVSYILSIVAAVLADTLFGRHRTAVISGCLELMVNICKQPVDEVVSI
jgi:dipeptide/tripeptide permease